MSLLFAPVQTDGRPLLLCVPMYSLALFQLVIHFFVMLISEATKQLNSSASAVGFLSYSYDNISCVFPFHPFMCLLHLLKDEDQFFKACTFVPL